jgi:hypothetical protein
MLERFKMMKGHIVELLALKVQKLEAEAVKL